jgi:hypothetical protein
MSPDAPVSDYTAFSVVKVMVAYRKWYDEQKGERNEANKI